MAANFDCPKCGAPENRVVNTRPIGNNIWRRRECRECGFRWNTYESSEIPRPPAQDDLSDLIAIFEKATAIGGLGLQPVITVSDAINIVRRYAEKRKGKEK